MPAKMNGVLLCAADVTILRADDDTVTVASLHYNASISALEVRGYVDEEDPRPTLVSAIGPSPIKIMRHHSGRVLCTVHFESAALGFPYECDPNEMRGGDLGPVKEVVILRGLRIEMGV